MKSNIEYEAEGLKYKPIVIGLVIVFLFVVLISFRPFDPAFNIKAFLVVLIFMILFCSFGFLIICGSNINSYRKLKKYKKRIIKNGIKIKGTVIDSEEYVRLYVNGVPTKYKYVAIIQTDKGDVFKTPYLLINPNKLLSKEVTVYKKNEEFFATDFNYDFSQKEKKTKKEKFKHIHSYDFSVPSKWQSIITLIFGMLFAIFMGWIIVKSADNTTRIIVLPFFIASVGVFLQGLLPLFMIDKILAVKISKRVYMAGFLLYLFGFLIVWDYLTLKSGQINLFLFSLIFWAVGIYVVIRWFLIKH